MAETARTWGPQPNKTAGFLHYRAPARKVSTVRMTAASFRGTSLRYVLPGEAKGVVVRAQVDLANRRVRLPFQIAVFLFISPSLLSATAQHAHGRGAISAQDVAKMAAPAAAGSDAADQVCARFATGSATTAPPELKSLNGVLEVTFKFLTATDSQGLVRYCYVTDTGLEAPTLRESRRPADHSFPERPTCCFRLRRQ